MKASSNPLVKKHKKLQYRGLVQQYDSNTFFHCAKITTK